MIDKILESIAPHTCCGCDNIGKILCINCQQSLIDEPYAKCVLCEAPTGGSTCQMCASDFDYQWCVGERSDIIQRVIDQYKFGRAKSASTHLACLLDGVVPTLPPETIVVSIPTVENHIRQRGYDHCKLIAAEFAKRRHVPYSPVLVRTSNTMQRGATRRERLQQAEKAFVARLTLEPGRPYLLIDDVVTTGATVCAAARTLRVAGAREVWLAVVAKAVDQNDARQEPSPLVK